ncbi:Zinc transporter 10 like [Actinidia chinensis var. chinensis]|uniref:Zinc transporter 10 like n=1 Tax=Actinidia chinensis var. chinensis TaxID=1590841 RepID=A0A2R6QMI1_ACTCC|nr:Zinc transporter 10 like [Actinidia chinensis var. chinensis]
MASTPIKFISIFFLLLTTFAPQVLSVAPKECSTETGDCINKSKALTLKIIAVVSILVTSMIGVCLPLVTRSIPALSPERSLFVIVKSFASGIILATGFMHVLPDSFDMLSSQCLPEQPWHKFPFTGFVAMLSAIVTLMVDSLATSLYSQKHNGILTEKVGGGHQEVGVVGSGGHFHGCRHSGGIKEGAQGAQLLRYRVVAMGATAPPGPAVPPPLHPMVLELGIIVHSVVIGLSMGASNNTCTIKPLVAALRFHQMFEGLGLDGCILQVTNSMETPTLYRIKHP